MKSKDFNKLFINELEDMYSAENQILASLPKMIKLATNKELKAALSHHLEETETQVTRIEEIFNLLGITAKEKPCKGMEGILKEGEEMVKGKTKSPALDAAIISAAQKVEHYEIASYGTLRSFAEHLDFSDDIIDRLQDSLDEEGTADKNLTKIADGSIFTSGVNKEAAKFNEKK